MGHQDFIAVDEALTGAIAILPTFFYAHGGVDQDSWESFMDQAMPIWQPDAVVVGGEMGEARSLTIEERINQIRRMAEYSARANLKYIVGVSSLNDRDTEVLVAAAKDCKRCIAVMFSPHTSCAGNVPAIIRSIDKIEGIPVIFQDFPAASRVVLKVAEISEICKKCRQIVSIKEEGNGTANRIRQLKEQLGDSVLLFGGLSGADLLNEMEAGAKGVITGAVFFELVSGIVRAPREKRAELFDLAFPILSADKIGGVAIRKKFFEERFNTPADVREPLIPFGADNNELYGSLRRCLPSSFSALKGTLTFETLANPEITLRVAKLY